MPTWPVWTRAVATLTRWCIDHFGCQQLRRDRCRRNLVPQVGLDFRKRDRVLLAGEADGVAVCAGAGRSSDSVHVVRRILRQIEIEHVADIRYVQSAGCNISCNQYRQLAVVEVT